MRRIAIIALAGFFAVLAGALLLSGQRSSDGVSLGAAMAQDAASVDTSMVKEMVLGNPDAKVTVIEYASFTCPHCRNFHLGPMKKLRSEYIDTGKIKFVFREVYFDRFGLWAGMLARCGDGMRYFGIVDLLFNQQREWLAGGDPGLIVKNLHKIGRTAGLTDDEINACLQDEAMAKGLVATFQKNTTADGVNATPTFIINGQKYSNMPWDEFKAILDEKLAQ